MSGRSGRVGLLFLGIFIGVLAGVMLACWLNHIGWDPGRITKFFNSGSEDSGKSAELVAVRADSVIPEQRMRSRQAGLRYNDTLVADTGALSFEEFAELYEGSLPDSLIREAYMLVQRNVPENVEVAKDEIQFTRTITVTGLPHSNQQALDSILIDDRGSKKSGTSVQVEFWRSPINYRGYKWDKRKLVLFGIDDFNDVSVVFLDDRFYMHHSQSYYRLDPSGEFMNLAPVSDNNLLKLLKSL